ncbi:spore coat protein U domain-containing protein [Psychrobacter sp. NG25]|uniref:Csu type fimbrial protein n=1 Tax=Psychrobacter sp. NG25 TaxID=2782005 RepID=UPI0018836D55|nr:spore coat protein U domain-containing protein [Psychrobacter sp. NG25]MBF0657788.1 spore coat protein U domain-containing protein [Psychrobacter sp. NG25]
MKFLRWTYSIFLIVGAWWLPSGNAYAVPNVTCEAGMNTAVGSTGKVNISDSITPANADDARISATLNYRCTNSGSAGYVSVCLAVDGGNNNSTYPPRYMKNGSVDSNLAFTMTLPGNIDWGTRNSSGSEFNSGSLAIAENSFISGSVAINVSLLSNYNNTLATSGTYTDDFNGSHTALTFKANEISSGLDCSTGNSGVDQFPFTVQATVIPSCLVTSTTDVNLGSHSANRNNIIGNNSSAIGVTCTNGAPYNIGLMPSNNNIDGAGMMSGTGNNTDKIPYQLRSTDGESGDIWGNTATSNNVGNGVIGTGDGTSQLKTVYVTALSADFRPDKYSDIVSIQVNY